jgi:phenylacetate-coenzyme A ligase PaaK-like adenylate-forming protein
MSTPNSVQSAQSALDAWVRDMVAWHFSPATGSDYWLTWAAAAKWNPIEEIKTFADILKFEHFDDEVLRKEQPERFVPRAFAGRPFNIFETGGTTGMPKQRIGWDDYKVDYEEFSDHYGPDFFPKGSNWLMVGPTGPRRLRLAIEHLANYRGGSCYFVDLDPRWVKRLIGMGEIAMARKYQEHVIDQAATIIRHRNITCMFTTPRLLENLAERMSLVKAGIKGVFAGGTTMTPQYVRFVVEEVLEGQINFAPTYGNTLMGLAISRTLTPADNYSLTYYAPQPRAVLRVVNPDQPDELVPYGEYGRVELTTMTKEFFMPRFLERDEAIRRPACPEFAWDGVGDVRPFQSLTKTIIEGVY